MKGGGIHEDKLLPIIYDPLLQNHLNDGFRFQLLEVDDRHLLIKYVVREGIEVDALTTEQSVIERQAKVEHELLHMWRGLLKIVDA